MNKEPIQIGYWHFSIRPFKFFFNRITNRFWQVRIGWIQIDFMDRES